MKSLILSALLALAAVASHAQSACTPSPSPLTKNCTTTACTVEACWATPDASLTGCNLYITAPGGALPAISGTMTTPGSVCTVTMPKLVSGTHSLNAAGINAFGEGAKMASPLSLVTGQPPGAASGLAVK